MSKFEIGDVVYIIYNNKIHSAIVIGIKVSSYNKHAVVSSLDNLIDKSDFIYTLVSISDTTELNKSRIATPDNLKHNFKIEIIYGEHQYTENNIFSTINDAIKNIKTMNNIVI